MGADLAAAGCQIRTHYVRRNRTSRCRAVLNRYLI